MKASSYTSAAIMVMFLPQPTKLLSASTLHSRQLTLNPHAGHLMSTHGSSTLTFDTALDISFLGLFTHYASRQSSPERPQQGWCHLRRLADAAWDEP